MRRDIAERYGEETLYEGGLLIRSTLDPKMQAMARKALVDGLVRFDEARGWRGAQQKIDLAGREWGLALAEVPALGRRAALAPRRRAGGRAAGRPRSACSRGGRPPARSSRTARPAWSTADGVKWTRRPVERAAVRRRRGLCGAAEGKPGQFRLRQIPEISGAIVAMDPYTGRVHAMVGGFSFDQSEFNRAIQAMRQPGSSFKPIVYATALDNGYTPSSQILDAPFVLDMGPGQAAWAPSNYDGKSGGLRTLRYGVEHSKNLMTVRLANEVGMPAISEYARRFGVYDDLLPLLSMSLGAGETTVMRMTAAYSMFVNGGRRIKPTLIDQIQDRNGRTIYRHDDRKCAACDAEKWDGGAAPKLTENREQVLDPLTAYQMTSILEGVVQRGTAQSGQGRRQAARRQDRHHERRQGRVVRRLLARSRGRRVPRLRPAEVARQRRDRRPVRRAGLPRLHADGAQGQARDAVPRAGRHQADPRQCLHRHPRRRRGRRHDPRSLQARPGAAGIRAAGACGRRPAGRVLAGSSSGSRSGP